MITSLEDILNYINDKSLKNFYFVRKKIISNSGAENFLKKLIIKK